MCFRSHARFYILHSTYYILHLTSSILYRDLQTCNKAHYWFQDELDGDSHGGALPWDMRVADCETSLEIAG